MIRFTLSQLADIASGELQGSDLAIDEVTSDTRKINGGLPVCGPQGRAL
ncbi:UDP-N-acetylmuramoyl-tripeptide--D-alanyl-D-alanine ligase [Raoultella terrigena]|nr:UDP-N-acetylmuramoyl-tripeptide--D-alanyl-D-alanine ligase [Raoultella terrigena]